jgi:S1-C subfamily serine protease
MPPAITPLLSPSVFPCFFFFSGLHSDYHKPSDTWEKINPGDAASLLILRRQARFSSRKGGTQGRDVLIQFGDKPIKNLYDFTDALRRSKVGDVVPVTVLRDGKELKVDVKLEQRK